VGPRFSLGCPKIALEYDLLQIAAKTGIPSAHEAARTEPLATIVRYVRKPRISDNRPHGVQGRGASRATWPSRFDFFPYNANGEAREDRPLIPGYVVGVPNARFTCTLAEDSGLLRDMLKSIHDLGLNAYLGTSEVFWTRRP
jgi:hypothetical protein